MYRSSSSNFSGNNNKYPSISALQDDIDREEVNSVLDKARAIRRQDVKMSSDALARIRNTEQTAEGTLVMLDSQSERMHKANADINVAKAESKVINEQIDELKRLDKWFSFRNPFKSKKSVKKLEEAKKQAQIEERMREDDETRKSRFESQSRLDETRRHTNRINQYEQTRRMDQLKHSDENNSGELELLDENDKHDESVIDANLDEIGMVARRLKMMASTMSTELDHQNQLIDKLGRNAEDMNVRVGIASHRIRKY